jgi:hypothetical protein
MAFPSEIANAVLDTFTTALAILVLSRSDLSVSNTSEFVPDTALVPTGMEGLGYLIPYIFGAENPSRYFKKQGVMPLTFRKFLLQRCRALANDILAKNSALSETALQGILDKTVVRVGSSSKQLYELTWQDLDPVMPPLTILESLGETNVVHGVALNPLTLAVDQASKVNHLMSFPYVDGLLGIVVQRPPSFATRLRSKDYGPVGIGAADFSPVIYAFDNAPPFNMSFCRNVLASNPTVFQAATTALSSWTGSFQSRLNASTDGSWESIRFIAQGLPDLEGFLGEITAFLDQISSGTQASTDTIVQYIAFVEARILELEALLQRLGALIDYLTSIEVPSVSALVVAGAGTDGLVQEFVSATNKPSDSLDARGAGVVVVAGGLPTPLVELLMLFFPTTGGA